MSDINSYTVSSIEFQDGFRSEVFSNVLEYRADKTPIIDSISPSTGDVFGGYNISLSGSYLDIGTP